ncbi:Glu-tRNA(Gln) amidotransferase subunit GatD [Candidatus Woesearchaeota archaeon]|nr:Glu-tRNA(Gln) amidotransferase subunit GatD [Candidatus Woesearchaeota archaeon]
MEFKQGDKIKVVTKDKEYIGIAMPNETDNLVIKLDNGYNVGLAKKSIVKTEVIEKFKPAERAEEKPESKKGLPSILILHTGGTIASKVDYRTGGVVARFEPEEILNMFPELRDIANIDSKLMTNIWSENITFKHLKKWAKQIAEEIKKNTALKGIIMTQGTDVLTSTSTALAFMLQNCPIPVILVGAQRSSDRGSSDAAMNLICAAEFIAKTDFAGVAICMHKQEDDTFCHILPSCKARKMHSSRRDAFRPINIKPYATVDYNKRKIQWIDKPEPKKAEFELKPEMEEKVGIVKTYINFNPKLFEAFKGYKGLIVEGTGLGQAPVFAQDKDSEQNRINFNALKELIDAGTIVFMTTQTIYGSVQMHVYSAGVDLVKAGVMEAKMLTETAYIKLAWLLGNYPKESKERIKELMQKDLIGEMFTRIEEDTFLI